MRELVTQAEMDSGAERDMPVRPSLEIGLFRMVVRPRIEVGGDQHGHDLLALLQPHVAELHVLAHEARLDELDGGHESQEFLDGLVGPAP